jgi:hypothetical protein
LTNGNPGVAKVAGRSETRQRFLEVSATAGVQPAEIISIGIRGTQTRMDLHRETIQNEASTAVTARGRVG